MSDQRPVSIKSPSKPTPTAPPPIASPSISDLPPITGEGGIAKATTVNVSRTVKVNGRDEASESAQEVIEIHRFVTTPAVIKFEQHIKPTRDYQSAGYSIGIELPCYVEEVDVAFERAKEIVLAGSRDLFNKNIEVLDRLCEMKRAADGR